MIEDNAIIGMGAIISLWSKIGQGAIVAEGAVVKSKQEVHEKVVVAGNPAKVVRNVSDKDEKLWNYGKQLYIDLARKYLEIGMQAVE